MTTQTKRAIVRWALLTPQSSSPLLTVFQGLLTARVAQTRAGLLLTMTAGNGHNCSYQLDPDMQPGDARDLAEELITRYEEALAALSDAEESGEPTDAEIAAEMLRCLSPVRRVGRDYSQLRSEPDEVNG